MQNAPNLMRAFRLVWDASKAWSLAWAALLIIQGLLPAATVYLSKLLVDRLVVGFGNGISRETAEPILFLAVMVAGVLLLGEILQAATEWIRAVQSELFQDHINSLVHEKSISVDLAFYESPEYYDRLSQARGEASNRPLALLESCGNLLQNGFTLISMGAILIPYGPWLPILLLLSTLPALYVVLRNNQRYYTWWRTTTTDRRRAQHYSFLMTEAWFASEVRLFGLGPYFQSAYRSLRQLLRSQRLRLLKSQSLANLGATLIGFLASGSALAWILWRSLLGLVTLGDVFLFYQTFQRAQSLVRSLFSSIGQVYANSLFLATLFQFLDLKPQIADPPKTLSIPERRCGEIRFKDVLFRYPGSNHLAVKNLDLVIPAGKIVAIVGPNGAGKTTVLKLLCRFYDPEAGRVELDGANIRDLSVADLRRKITVLFQLPVSYQATASQNIALGDIEAATKLSIEAAARAAGAHEIISSLPRGYDTTLGKWFSDGVELSAGEWQRIAMARAYLRQAGIIILDEPTSFMDSWAEVNWFERLRDLARGRTVLIITHRLPIAMRADTIHVMREGEIVESGSHEELLLYGGLYANSWSAQIEGSPLSASVRG